ncbi:BRO-N domain-containing protein [Streptomyces blattellae]|uniref:BRO-N domain-containing protein n=1 Tax=Streptomyces blattellae TaxID=2569855 RepID=UPI0012B7A437|nr:BRO family protein [Streptomyces blattellae]
MNEQNNTEQRQDAIDINDFVFAATGARVRRLTAPDGEHWFVAADVATDLGYANTRQALAWHVAPDCQAKLGDLAQSVYGVDASSKIAGHGLKKSMKLVNLRGLITQVNGCTKPECGLFKAWVSEVIATIQRDGSYSLDPSPAQTPATGEPAYVMPKQVADAIVRLEVRNIRADEMMVAFQDEQTVLLRQISRSQNTIAEALLDIAQTLKLRRPDPNLTPQQLLTAWKAKNLVVTEDIHAVAAYLAPALVRGEASYRLDEIATRTGLTSARVHDSLRILLKRGCIRQTGCTAEGAPIYVLP